MAIGMNIKKIAKEKGMTLKEVSDKSGVSIHTLYAITKKDDVNVRYETLERIAEALDVGVRAISPSAEFFMKMTEAIMRDLDEMEYVEDSDPNMEHEGSIFDRLEQCFNRLNEAGRKKLFEYAEDLVRIDIYTEGLFDEEGGETDE